MELHANTTHSVTRPGIASNPSQKLNHDNITCMVATFVYIFMNK